MDVFDAIKSRCSIREFMQEAVPSELVETMLEAGRWAPSGLNNQPWKFKVVEEAGIKAKLAGCTKYSRVVEGAPVCIAVFLDKNEPYDRTKDVQAIGACIQNMLLAAHALGLGAVWLGEILNQREIAEKILEASESCELMAVLAVGRPKRGGEASSRKNLDELIV